VNDGEMMRLLGQERQVLAESDARRTRGNWLELATILDGRIRFHVPGVDVRGAAAKPQEDARPGRLTPCWLRCRNETRQVHAAKAKAASDEKRAAIEGRLDDIVAGVYGRTQHGVSAVAMMPR